jgi:hypothetical protein
MTYNEFLKRVCFAENDSTSDAGSEPRAQHSAENLLTGRRMNAPALRCKPEILNSTSDAGWGPMHVEMEAKGAKIVNTGCSGVCAVVNKSLATGTLSLEAKIDRMSGTLFIGVIQVERFVVIKKGRPETEVKTVPMDMHW